MLPWWISTRETCVWPSGQVVVLHTFIMSMLEICKVIQSIVSSQQEETIMIQIMPIKSCGVGGSARREGSSLESTMNSTLRLVLEPLGLWSLVHMKWLADLRWISYILGGRWWKPQNVETHKQGVQFHCWRFSVWMRLEWCSVLCANAEGWR